MACSTTLLRFGGKTDHQARAPIRVAGDAGENVRILGQVERRDGVAVLFQLLAGFRSHTPICHGSCKNRDIRRQGLFDRLIHLAGGFDPNHLYAWRISASLPARRDSVHAGAEIPRRLGQSIALFAGGPVGDVAHGINRFMGRARRDQHMAAGQGHSQTGEKPGLGIGMVVPAATAR